MLSVCKSCGSANQVDESRAEAAVCGACKTALPDPRQPREIVSVEDFKRVIAASPIPVLVDFWASWCAPCRQVAPQIARLARDYGERVAVAKVDTEALPDIAASFQIRGIPTFIVFKDGKEVTRASGYRPAEDLAVLAQV